MATLALIDLNNFDRCKHDNAQRSSLRLDSHTQTSNRDRAPRVAGHDARRVDRANEQTTPTIQSPRAAAGAAFISGSARGEAVPRRDARDG
jgi:hypothetical protein